MIESLSPNSVADLARHCLVNEAALVARAPHCVSSLVFVSWNMGTQDLVGKIASCIGKSGGPRISLTRRHI